MLILNSRLMLVADDVFEIWRSGVISCVSDGLLCVGFTRGGRVPSGFSGYSILAHNLAF